MPAVHLPVRYVLPRHKAANWVGRGRGQKSIRPGRACGQYACRGRLLRHSGKARLAQHLADCLGETDGPVGKEFPLECPNCGGDIRLIAFITEPGPIQKILTHLGGPLEPPPVSPARGPPADWADLVQAHDDRDIFQASPDELPAIDIHSL